ncbi:capsule biosynthesis GfcC family protein [Klebsiella michiganensis]|uniref:capsule biosynthesis GfcC family protein n=1 Tax=Klebsiella michiganensis TaxID=1134687 RepID=UPI003F50A751
MKIKISLSVLCAMMVIAATSVQADGRVTIYSPDGKPVQVLNQIRNLRQLVAEPAFGNYQPGLVISTPEATRQANQALRQTLAKLDAWAKTEKGARAAAVRQVMAQLSELKVTGRQFTSLDPVQVNNNDTANRTLDGEYDLYLASETRTVMLAGPVSGAGVQRWMPGRDVGTYLDGHHYLSGADHDQVTVIDPDGGVRIAHVGAWNYHHIEAQPGSIILVGFSSQALPEGEEDLNNNIVAALTHRIPD